MICVKTSESHQCQHPNQSTSHFNYLNRLYRGNSITPNRPGHQGQPHHNCHVHCRTGDGLANCQQQQPYATATRGPIDSKRASRNQLRHCRASPCWRGRPRALACLSRWPVVPCAHPIITITITCPPFSSQWQGVASIAFVAQQAVFDSMPPSNLYLEEFATSSSDRTSSKHLLAQIVLVVSNRASPRLDRLVLAHQNLLSDLVQQPMVMRKSGQLHVLCS